MGDTPARKVLDGGGFDGIEGGRLCGCCRGNASLLNSNEASIPVDELTASSVCILQLSPVIINHFHGKMCFCVRKTDERPDFF